MNLKAMIISKCLLRLNILQNLKIKHWLITTAIFGAITVFVPSQCELFTIYGIGGTIDYIKSSDTAKQLPDKCINALDKYLNEITDGKD